MNGLRVNLKIHMSSLNLVKKNKQSLVPAITHIDGTARVQTVDKEKKF